jgi:hypothetical protein
LSSPLQGNVKREYLLRKKFMVETACSSKESGKYRHQYARSQGTKPPRTCAETTQVNDSADTGLTCGGGEYRSEATVLLYALDWGSFRQDSESGLPCFLREAHIEPLGSGLFREPVECRFVHAG